MSRVHVDDFSAEPKAPAPYPRDTPGITERQWQTFDQQERDWPKVMVGARQGNPYATMCLHCHGRHRPPHNELCPNQSLEGAAAKSAFPPRPVIGGAG